ncbi:hypothetical protein FB451DRAFT_1301597 [Mycena latifolia]|nr:hypothetical protein FB451DRAFT_1301597 [Mycena latifolia]
MGFFLLPLLMFVSFLLLARRRGRGLSGLLSNTVVFSHTLGIVYYLYSMHST